MAKLSDLEQVLCDLTGMDKGKVHKYSRTLREGKLIRSGGRGFGAADMTVTDVANLLIAICTSTTIKESCRMVEAVRSLPINENYANFDGDEWTGWKKWKNFGEACEAVISNMCLYDADLIPTKWMCLKFEISEVPESTSVVFKCGCDGIYVDIAWYGDWREASLVNNCEQQPVENKSCIYTSREIDLNLLFPIQEFVKDRILNNNINSVDDRLSPAFVGMSK